MNCLEFYDYVDKFSINCSEFTVLHCNNFKKICAKYVIHMRENIM
jgi:hypothetical protein